MAHPRGVQESNDFNAKERLTGNFRGTQFCGVPSLLANRIDPPPIHNEKAPVSAATDTRAETVSGQASGQGLDTLTRWQMQFVIMAHGIRPDLAAVVASLAFGRACA